jgi:transcriptional regulator with XRE-family HTH domain
MTKENLRTLRRSLDITQDELAKMSGVSLATVNRAEKSGDVLHKTMTKLFNTLKTHYDNCNNNSKYNYFIGDLSTTAMGLAKEEGEKEAHQQ